MTVYEFRDYKAFLKSWVAAQPRKGRGLIRRMAEHLNMSSAMMSHILQGDKHLSLEAGNDLAAYLNLDEEAGEYFLLLIMYARAGNFSLQERLRRRVEKEQKKAREVTQRIKADVELPDLAKAVFYSNWVYSGVRNLTACPTFNDVDRIAQRLKLDRHLVQKVVDFLLQHNLCVLKDGKLDVGPQQTHVGHTSAFVSKHHQNWRLKGFERMLETGDHQLFFTGPMSLSQETAEAIRQRLPGFIEEIRALVRPSPSEVVRCLNIDWFEY